jgi:CubicO group peptidase (beta-lactamase class C family)
MNLRAIGMSAVAACIAFSAFAQDVSKVTRPEDAGFSSDRLQRLSDAMQADVDKGAIPGAVVMVSRNGKLIYSRTFGFQDREKQVPMKSDAIFRIASMSKPFVSVAVMMLVEQGKIMLNDPVSVYLPELKNLQVGVEKTDATGKPELVLEPVRAEPTIQDLLRHTSGFTYGFFGKPSLVKQANLSANLLDPTTTLADFVTKLSKLPLAYQPGTTWDYGVSTDVLGRIVEVVSGVALDQFIADRIVKPLGLSATGFYTANEDAARVAEPQVDPATGKRPPMADPRNRPNLMSGGGGMVSTAPDYLRFAEMLLNGGKSDRVRLLSSRTVALMTADQLPPDTVPSPVGMMLGITPRNGTSFGLGFSVRTQAGRNPLPGSPGLFAWSGIFGTSFWVDPNEKLVGVAMLQVPFSQEARYRLLVRNLVYQALAD